MRGQVRAYSRPETPPPPRRRWVTRNRTAVGYVALMALCAAGSLHRGRFDGLGLLVVIGCGAGVVVLLALLALDKEGGEQ